MTDKELLAALLRYIPRTVLESLVEVMIEGGRRPGRAPMAWRWQREPWHIRESRARHAAQQLVAGDDVTAIDADSGQPHLTHVVANAIMELDLLLYRGGRGAE